MELFEPGFFGAEFFQGGRDWHILPEPDVLRRTASTEGDPLRRNARRNASSTSTIRR